MAETKQFVLEGEMTLAYFIGEHDAKHVLIQDEDAASDGLVTEAISKRRLEAKIADELGFPNQSEFDAMRKKLSELSNKGLRPVEGIPDYERKGVKLRITVEVL